LLSGCRDPETGHPRAASQRTMQKAQSVVVFTTELEELRVVHDEHDCQQGQRK
jgi:hypothetical protein